MTDNSFKYTDLTDKQLRELLLSDDETFAPYADAAREIVMSSLGGMCYMRGLIETHNGCVKDCLYCGIRRSNSAVARYSLSDDEIVETVVNTVGAGYGSIVLQGGEQRGEAFVGRVERLLRRIASECGNKAPAVTLSFGEQSLESYRRWRSAGAHRYLLRIESSRESLYRSIHPDNELHSHARRVEALYDLRKADFQVGTGVMIGLPGQTTDDLVADLRFMRDMDIDMCGMGPYLEHKETPLYARAGELLPANERLRLSLRMITLLRLLMPTINIAATTALQAIDPDARTTALRMGANVMMPNITPMSVKAEYKLYENKPLGENSLTASLTEGVTRAGLTPVFGGKGTSRHYLDRLALGADTPSLSAMNFEV